MFKPNYSLQYTSVMCSEGTETIMNKTEDVGMTKHFTEHNIIQQNVCLSVT